MSGGCRDNRKALTPALVSVRADASGGRLGASGGRRPSRPPARHRGRARLPAAARSIPNGRPRRQRCRARVGKDGRRSTAAAFVGIDVARDRPDVHVRPAGEAFALARDEAATAALAERLAALRPALAVPEAAGGPQARLAGRPAAAGLPVAVVDPRQSLPRTRSGVRGFARAVGRLAKTDRLDAAAVARFAEAVRPEPRPLDGEATLALGAPVARRREPVAMRTAEGDRRAGATPRVRRSVEAVPGAIDAQLAGLDRDLDAAVRGGPLWRAKGDPLRSVPGVGPVTSRALLAGPPGLGRPPGRKISALVGVAPLNRDSGSTRGRRTVRGGRAGARTAPFVATVAAVRHDAATAGAHRRLRAAGEPAKVALVAATRKLLPVLDAVVRTGTAWKAA